MALRTMVADASVRYYRMNVAALRGEQNEVDASILSLTPEEARENLKMLEFTDREIDMMQANEVFESEQVDDFEKRAMYHGSTLINFRGGADFLPPALVGNSSFQRFLRVFNSFAYNILVAQAKYIWVPAVKGGAPGRRRAAIKRGISVYAGAMVTAELAEFLIGLIRPEDDEDELYDGWLAGIHNNLATVGLLGKLERPGELLSPTGMSGVTGRTLSNTWTMIKDQVRAGEDVLDGNFSDAAKLSMSAIAALAFQEVSHLRAMRDLYRQANPGGSNQKYYQTTRQISRARSRADKRRTERWDKDNQKFSRTVFAPQRTALVNAIVAGKDANAMKRAAQELVGRMLRRKPDLTPKEALQNARQSVMMLAPLSEFSRTTDVEKAKKDLEEFRADMTERRGKKATERMIAMHLAYVEGVNLALPRTK